MLTRPELEQREEAVLAPYAMKSRASRGRAHPEPEHPYRNCYQRDRDRIIHSRAFRLLQYKTQVFVNHEGDYYRTRLTHTIEASQISRSIARALRLNEDLTEAVTLVHDLGHTCFGHSGEDALREIMKDHGGFDHNSQALRIIESLEKRYPEFPGLNLSWEVREGIVKHATVPERQPPAIARFDPQASPPLETQIVDLADEIAYDNHDLDDGLTSGLIKEEELQEVELWRRTAEAVRQAYPVLDEERLKYQVIRRLIDLDVTDLIEHSLAGIRAAQVQSIEDIRRIPARLVAFGPTLLALRDRLRAFLHERLYHHYRVVRMADKAQRFIKELFAAYLARPDQLPPSTRRRLETEDRYRVMCDYIAGMTDRYATDEYQKLFQP